MIDKVARFVMGIIFVVFGFNYFLQFLPMPQMTQAAGKFIGALIQTGYLFPWLKVTEIVCGALFLLNRFVPLATVIIAPVIFNILLFHLFLAPSGLLIPVILLVSWIIIVVKRQDDYKGLLK